MITLKCGCVVNPDGDHFTYCTKHEWERLQLINPKMFPSYEEFIARYTGKK